jgi:hypothetical protein
VWLAAIVALATRAVEVAKDVRRAPEEMERYCRPASPTERSDPHASALPHAERAVLFEYFDAGSAPSDGSSHLVWFNGAGTTRVFVLAASGQVSGERTVLRRFDLPRNDIRDAVAIEGGYVFLHATRRERQGEILFVTQDGTLRATREVEAFGDYQYARLLSDGQRGAYVVTAPRNAHRVRVIHVTPERSVAVLRTEIPPYRDWRELRVDAGDEHLCVVVPPGTSPAPRGPSIARAAGSSPDRRGSS